MISTKRAVKLTQNNGQFAFVPVLVSGEKNLLTESVEPARRLRFK